MSIPTLNGNYQYKNAHNVDTQKGDNHAHNAHMVITRKKSL